MPNSSTISPEQLRKWQNASALPEKLILLTHVTFPENRPFRPRTLMTVLKQNSASLLNDFTNARGMLEAGSSYSMNMAAAYKTAYEKYCEALIQTRPLSLSAPNELSLPEFAAALGFKSTDAKKNSL